jgi:hypothetical protein
MSESDSTKSPPEPPEIVKWGRWIGYYFAREGKVIWQAKGIFVLSALLLVVASGFATWRTAGIFYEERMSSKDATISIKDANIKYLEAQIGPREKIDPTKTLDSDLSSRFELSFQVGPPNATTSLWVNIYTANKGNLPASAPLHYDLALYTDRILDGAALDVIFANMIKAANYRDDQQVTSQIYPGQPAHFFSIFNVYDDKMQLVKIDDAKYQSIKDGYSRLYIFTFLVYKDKTTPAKKWRATEGCAYVFRRGSLSICSTHNTTGLID